MAVRFYCVKCRKPVELQDGQFENITMKNGKPAKRGKCTTCGTTMFRIG